MCGAAEQTQVLPPGTDLSKATVLTGTVQATGEPVGGAFVRLLDSTGEFTAEVPTSATGHFRFFANTGRWTLRTLAPRADVVDRAVDAEIGRVAEVTIAI